MVNVPRLHSGFGRRGLVFDVCSLVTIFAFGIFILMIIAVPLLTHMREMAKRTTCAANMSGMGKGLHIYANDGNQGMPIAAHAKAVEREKGRVTYAPGMIGKHRGESEKPAAGESDDQDTELSTTRNLWTLVRMGGSTPAAFICPSSSDQKNDEDNPQDFWDFRNYKEVSYGYQVPYGKVGWPSGESDQRCLLAADKGPYGAALEAAARDPGVPTRSPTDPEEQWRPWNSLNHRRQGQNCLYADAHVEWSEKPTAGPRLDNIYTRWSDASGGTADDSTVRSRGTPPTGMETPWGNTDALIYP